MRHIITGGSGFVGRHLAEAIARRHENVVLFDTVRPVGELPEGCNFVEGDVTSLGDMERIGFGPDDVVHHLAARVYHNGAPRRNRAAWFAEVNVNGTRQLLEAMKHAGVRRGVFFSTDMVYGPPQVTPVPTTHARAPIGPYGQSKRDAEDLIEQSRNHGIRFTVFRPRLITGPGRFGILVKLFELIRRNFPVPLIGDGSNRYQMVAASDCALAALSAVDLDCPPGPFNLGSREPPRVRELLSSLIHRVGSRSRLLPTPARLVKAALAAMDGVGVPLMYPEQFRIADLDYVLDLTETRRVLAFEPSRTDQDMMVAAYEEYLRGIRASG